MMMTDGIRNVLTGATAFCQTVRLNLISVDSHGDLDLALSIRPRANLVWVWPEVHSTEPQHGAGPDRWATTPKTPMLWTHWTHWTRPRAQPSRGPSPQSRCRCRAPETSRPSVPPNVVGPLRQLQKHLPNLLLPTFCTSPPALRDRCGSAAWCTLKKFEVHRPNLSPEHQHQTTLLPSRRPLKMQNNVQNCTYIVV